MRQYCHTGYNDSQYWERSTNSAVPDQTLMEQSDQGLELSLPFSPESYFDTLTSEIILLNGLNNYSSRLTLMPAFTTIACLTRTYAIISGSYKYELTRAQARISSKLIGFIT